MPDIQVPRATGQASNPPLETSIVSDHFTRRWIESFPFANRVLVDVEAYREDRRERVTELNDAERSNNRNEAKVVGD